MPLDSVTVSATFRGTTERMFGSVKTDSTGAYAIILPDIEGIWNMQLSPQVKGKEAEYRITVDRHFAPPLRPLESREVRQIPVDTARIHRWQIAPQDEQEWQNMYEKNATVRAYGNWVETWSIWSHRAPAEDMIVVSEIGEQ